MRVHLSFDVEVWCNDWNRLDEVFPKQFERYVYGRSRHGDYALPAILDILRKHRLRGIFFVEALFSARFGAQYLKRIVELIRSAGHEVQLHAHAEWINEIEPAVIANNTVKRQHLTDYDVEEQTSIIGHAKRLLQDAGSGDLTAFRAGSFAANLHTLVAVGRNGIGIDSSMNAVFAHSGTDVRALHGLLAPFQVGTVPCYPATVFRDGFGRQRPAQVGACSFEEMRDALSRAHASGREDFVIYSHNFELLKPGTSEPEWMVASRFDKLCGHLDAHRHLYTVCSYTTLPQAGSMPPDTSLLTAGFSSTAKRHLEQIRRRFG